MNDLVFYNRNGRAVGYSEDGIHIYLFNGNPVAYFNGDSVYSFSGSHLGRFEDGWIRDNRGACAFFTINAYGGPVNPVKHVRPVKGVKHVKPVKGVKHVKPVRPIKSLSWSSFSSESYFDQ